MRTEQWELNSSTNVVAKINIDALSKITKIYNHDSACFAEKMAFQVKKLFIQIESMLLSELSKFEKKLRTNKAENFLPIFTLNSEFAGSKKKRVF